MIRERNGHSKKLDDVSIRRWENEGGALGHSAIKKRSDSRDAASSAALQRLFALQEYSLAKYAAQAELYGRNEARRSFEAIKEIAAAQTDRAAAIGRLLADRRVPIEHGGFPLRFTSVNYVSAQYVVELLLSQQPALIAEINACLASLSGDPEAESLARDVWAGEMANLHTLRRIAKRTKAESDQLALAA